MNHQFDELTKQMSQSVGRHGALKNFGVGLAGLALACLCLLSTARAQNSVVCDPAGDAIFGNGKGGPQVPAWLDIAQARIIDAGDNILFTLTVNAPIPLTPAWNTLGQSGQMWWSWRLIGDIDDLTFVSNGCLQANGQNVPAVYCLDLIWNIKAGSFRARLLDDTTCAETAIAVAFSPDRREINMLVSKTLFTNTDLIPDPNSFDFLTEVIAWKDSSNGNTSLSILDTAPSQNWVEFILGTWSSTSNSSYGCP